MGKNRGLKKRIRALEERVREHPAKIAKGLVING